MKEKILFFLNRYQVVILTFLIILFGLRLFEYFLFKASHTLPAEAFGWEMKGFLYDFFLLNSLAAILFLPCLILSMIFQRLGIILLQSVLLFLACLGVVLTVYLNTTLVPLDGAVFAYTRKELVMIAGSSGNLSFPVLGGFVLFIAGILILQYLTKKINIHRRLLSFLWLLTFSSLFLSRLFKPVAESFETDFDYHLAMNKTRYFAGECWQYMHQEKPDSPDKIQYSALVRQYQSTHDYFRYAGPSYPFLHYDDTPDDLGKYFRFDGQNKPNLVFIVVESLSTDVCGEYPYFGSFMPFLDSLIGHSLYWQNFLSTSDRTYNALQAIMASLPYGNGEFQDDPSIMPDHLSLIRYARENGYYTSFFYGGDAGFSGMNNFIKAQGTDYILSYFGPRYTREESASKQFYWGYHDKDLFERSFEVIDSLRKNPRMDIYLTLSTHNPFHPPDIESYRARVEKIIRLNKKIERIQEESRYSKDILASVLYLDDALRYYINEYRKRDDFNNTIFIITGDHNMGEFNVNRYTSLEYFHVPLIIYSPLLKEPVKFQSVSSHYDIAPSILAMMKNNAGWNGRPYSHWLGTGIDCGKDFRIRHSLPLLINNRTIIYYIENEIFLRNGQLTRIMPELGLEVYNDAALKQKMINDMYHYERLSKLVNSKNILYPDDELFQIRSLPINIPVKDQVKLTNPGWPEGFVKIMPGWPLPPDINFLNFEVSFRYKMKSSDTFKAFPVLVAEVKDQTDHTLIWRSFPARISDVKSHDTGTWKQALFSGDLTLTAGLKDKHIKLKMYLWNNDLMYLQYDTSSLVRILKGTK
jgi:phosphoglycerol transferase MdoB-like AlkP superfamily enzyme